jgi:hypothetical protein
VRGLGEVNRQQGLHVLGLPKSSAGPALPDAFFDMVKPSRQRLVIGLPAASAAISRVRVPMAGAWIEKAFETV